MRFCAILLGLAACGEASHLPNPLLLPGAAVSTALENGVYNARRDRVKAYVLAQQPRIAAQIKAGGGTELNQAMELARVPEPRRAALLARLQADLPLYLDDAEALTVALMVHGN